MAPQQPPHWGHDVTSTPLSWRSPRTLGLAIPLLALAACATPPSPPAHLAPGDYRYVEEYLSWHIPRQMKKHNVPGVSIALVDDQRVIWARGFGHADRERRIPATADTVYQAGSISKVLTAAAVMQLAEHGVMDLDEPIQRYLPEFSMRSRWGEAPPSLSLRALLSHHAGLPTFYLKGFFSRQPLGEFVKALRDEHLAYPPDRVFNYSNLGPNLAGAAIERLTGKGFAAHMHEALLEPLGMANSAFELTPAIAARLARGYVKSAPSDPITIRDVPAGGLFSSVNDLARFMRLVLAGGELDGRRILKPESVAEMLTPQYPDRPLDLGQRFGLGWMLSGITVHGGGTVAWHNGGTKSFLGQMLLLPEKRLGVVVLANSDSAASLVYDTAELALQLALEARDGITPPPPSAPAAAAVRLPAEVLERYSGDYSLMGVLAHVKRRGERLALHVFGHTLDLVPVGHDEFRAEYRLLGLIPVSIRFPPVQFARVEGRDLMLLKDRGVLVTAEKIPAYPIPAAWARRAGEYRLVNPDPEYLVDLKHARLTIEDGKLLMDMRISGLEDRNIKVVLMPLSDDAVYVFGLGRNVGDVAVTERHGARELMRFSGYYFERASQDTGTSLVLGR